MSRFVICSPFENRNYTRVEISRVLSVPDAELDGVEPPLPAPVQLGSGPPVWYGATLACWFHLVMLNTGAGGPAPPTPPVPRPNKASGPCARAILAALYRAGHRLTSGQIRDALADAPGRNGAGLSRDAIEGTLSWLMASGHVNNARDGRGKGYGLTCAGVPVFEGEPVLPPE